MYYINYLTAAPSHGQMSLNRCHYSGFEPDTKGLSRIGLC